MGVRRWRELVIDRENGEVLFDRPKPTAGCSANGRRKIWVMLSSVYSFTSSVKITPVSHKATLKDANEDMNCYVPHFLTPFCSVQKLQGQGN
jgi:hypothetical protein